jgi:hypothetical protein
MTPTITATSMQACKLRVRFPGSAFAPAGERQCMPT